MHIIYTKSLKAMNKTVISSFQKKKITFRSKQLTRLSLGCSRAQPKIIGLWNVELGQSNLVLSAG